MIIFPMFVTTYTVIVNTYGYHYGNTYAQLPKCSIWNCVLISLRISKHPFLCLQNTSNDPGYWTQVLSYAKHVVCHVLSFQKISFDFYYLLSNQLKGISFVYVSVLWVCVSEGPRRWEEGQILQHSWCSPQQLWATQQGAGNGVQVLWKSTKRSNVWTPSSALFAIYFQYLQVVK